MIHNIKIQYPYADAIINNRKTFEVRLNDRGYNVGDTIQFRVMDGSIDMPHILNDREYEITYVHSGLGLEKGFVVFGIKQKARMLCIRDRATGKRGSMTREEAIVDIRDNIKPVVGGKSLDMAIEALEHKTEWIPVSERLPEDSGYCLTTTMYGEVYCDQWTGIGFDRQETVIAWMPLPEPYKAESEEE